MTWHFDPSGETLNSIQFTDGQGNTFDVASGVAFSGSWRPPAPETAVEVAAGWCAAEAAAGNTQTALTGLADLVAEDWAEGTA